MIDLEHERAVTLAQAVKLLPGRPNLSTLWRWRLHGVRGIKLETILSGGKRYTTIEALRRFQHAVTAASDGEPVRTDTPGQRERAIDRAERRAQELGV